MNLPPIAKEFGYNCVGKTSNRETRLNIDLVELTRKNLEWNPANKSLRLGGKVLLNFFIGLVKFVLPKLERAVIQLVQQHCMQHALTT
jgi:hypothetical protein